MFFSYDVLCTYMSARCEPRRLFGLGLLGVWRAELSELLCDFAAWFSASPVSSSVVRRCSWLGVCSAAAGVSASGSGELWRSRRASRRLFSGRVSAGFPTKLWQMPILSSHLFAVAARDEDALYISPT